MKRPWKKLSEGVSLGVLLVVVLLGAVIIIPTTPFILLYAHFSNKQFQKRYQQFLTQMNGACFFCYNSRTSSVAFARGFIVPELAASVRVVFVDGNKVVADADSDYISKILYSITERKGFPYLLKIGDGQLLNLSVNNQFYSSLIGRKSIVPLLNRVNSFFVSTTPESLR